MRMNLTLASALKRRLSSVFLPHNRPHKGHWLKRPHAWAAAGQAIELAHRQPSRFGLPGRAAIALAFLLAARLGWVWS